MKKKSQRKLVVLTSLVGLLTLTSALLLVLAPPPLSAQGYASLSAADRSDFLDDIFKTGQPTRADHWKYIYIHHSDTFGGNAQTLAQPGVGLCDHFLIGNGNGCADGEVDMTQRWNAQQPAAAAPGIDHIDPTCISVCLVGDYDQQTPTPAQLRRLTQLVSTLQSQLRIPADHVVALSQPGTPSGIGRYFPTTAFREQILP